MKKIVLIYLLLPLFAVSQNWQPLSSGLNFQMRELFADTVNDKLYVGGNFWKADGMDAYGIAQWDGSSWDTLKAGMGATGGIVYAITGYANSLYVSGSFFCCPTSLGNWDGTNWHFPDTINDIISDFYVDADNNNLYVVGDFTTINGLSIKRVARFDGSNWYPVGNVNWTGGSIMAITQYNGDIYICGNMWQNPIYKIGKWNGTDWSAVGGGFQGAASFPRCMAVYKNELYVGGSFSKQDGNIGNFIQKWNGTSWLEVGGGLSVSGGGIVSSLLVHNNELYVGGWFENAGGVSAQCIAKWDGTNWCGFGDTILSDVQAIEVYKNELYIGGAFKAINSDTMNYIAKWIGGNYVDTCGNTSGVSDLENAKGQLGIFPNPASGVFTIQISNNNKQEAVIEIYNVMGEKIVSIPNTDLQAASEIDLSNQPKGIYFIKAASSENIYTGTVVIQ